MYKINIINKMSSQENTRTVILEKPNDLTFMGLNIFAHDFLHDFNATKFGARMTSIKSGVTKALDEFNLFIENRTAVRGGSISRKSNSSKSKDEFDDIFYQNFDKYVNLVEKLKIGKITRSVSVLIQQIETFIYETKLYLIGMINMGNIKGGAMTAIRNNNTQIHKLKNSNNTSKQAQHKTIQNPLKTKIKIQEENTYQYYDFYENVIIDAFANTIRICEKEEASKPLVNYFTFMGELYLHLRNPNVNPFQTLNHPYLEEGVFLSFFIKNKNVSEILNFLTTEKRESKKGGADTPEEFSEEIQDDTQENLKKQEELETFKNEIETTFPELYEYYSLKPNKETLETNNENPETNNEDKIFSKFTYDKMKEIKDNIISFKIPDPYISSLFKDKIMNKRKEEINENYKKYKYLNENQERIRGFEQKLEIARHSLLDSMKIYLFNHLYSGLKEEIVKLTPITSNTKKLTAIQKNDVQMISVIVAKGGYNYINRALTSQTVKNKVLKKELEILEEIINKNKNISKLDEEIRTTFTKYAKEIDPNRVITNWDTIKNTIAGQNKKVIDNAVDTKVFSYIGINEKTDIICPTSSVVDAMGVFGSCYTSEKRKTIQNPEYYDMNFEIKDNENSNYYQGITKLKTTNGKTKVKVIFSAFFYELYLPEVVIDIDISEPKKKLAANATFKGVIDKILHIWARIFDGKTVPDPELLWQSLESKTVFTELVRAGSVKSVGDLFQEINSVVEMGGYSVSIPNFNNILRIGAMGDKPSGVRAGYLLLRAISGVNQNSIAGFISPTNNGNSVVISGTAVIKNTNTTNAVKTNKRTVDNPQINASTKKQKTVLGGKTTKKKKIQKKTRKIKLRKPY